MKYSNLIIIGYKSLKYYFILSMPGLSILRYTLVIHVFYTHTHTHTHTQETRTVGEDVQRKEPLHTVDGNETGEQCEGSSKKLKIELPYDP